MPHPDQAVVTGAFSYTGRYVARRLLEEGVGVRTLTRSAVGWHDNMGVLGQRYSSELRRN